MPSASTVSINTCIQRSLPRHHLEGGISPKSSFLKSTSVCGVDSNNLLAWPMDIFASERCKLQEILQSSPVKSACSSESLYKPSFPCLEQHCSNEATTSKWQSSAGTSDTKAYQQQQQNMEKHLSDLSAALDSSFANSSYIPLSNSHLWHQQSYKFSEEVFNKESGLLQYMGMLVPLKSQEAAMCSRTNTFEYIPLHVRDPTLSEIFVCEDYKIPSPQMKDLNDTSVPEHVRKGISYDECDLINFNPEVSSIKCYQKKFTLLMFNSLKRLMKIIVMIFGSLGRWIQQ